MAKGKPKRPKFRVGQVVKLRVYTHEYVQITEVWAWTVQDGTQHGWGYTLKTSQPAGKDRCHENKLRPLTARERGFYET